MASKSIKKCGGWLSTWCSQNDRRRGVDDCSHARKGRVKGALDRQISREERQALGVGQSPKESGLVGCGIPDTAAHRVPAKVRVSCWHLNTAPLLEKDPDDVAANKARGSRHGDDLRLVCRHCSYLSQVPPQLFPTEETLSRLRENSHPTLHGKWQCSVKWIGGTFFK